jgi:osmotically-inducible protein OsmY
MSDYRRWGDRDVAGDRDRYDLEAGRREQGRFGGPDRQGYRDDFQRRGAGPQTYERGADEERWRGYYGAGEWPNPGSDYGYDRDAGALRGDRDYGDYRGQGRVAGGRTDRDSLRDIYDRNDAYRGSTVDDQERGFFDKAGDRVSSWFGDRDAERRVQADRNRRDGEHRGRGPSGYRRSDERIREDVSDRLSDDSWIDASNIEVQVANGEVTLNGTVHDRQDKRHAEDLAERVSGVAHVQNNLRVKSPTAGGQTPGAFNAGSVHAGTGQSASGQSAMGSASTASTASGSQPGSTSSAGAHQASTAKETL